MTWCKTTQSLFVGKYNSSIGVPFCLQRTVSFPHCVRREKDEGGIQSGLETKEEKRSLVRRKIPEIKVPSIKDRSKVNYRTVPGYGTVEDPHHPKHIKSHPNVLLGRNK